MSSVRINQHSRPDATPGSGGETSRLDVPPGGATFAVTLGAAAFIPKGSAAALSGAPAKGATDGATTSRKRTGGDGASADAAAVLAAQGSLLAAAVGQASLASHDVVDARATSATASDGNLGNPAISGAGQPAEEIASISTAPGNDAANVLLRPQATNAPALAASDGSTPGSAPAAAAVEVSGATSNLGPQLPTAPGLNLAPAPPPVLAGIGQAILPPAAGQPGAGNNDAASGGDTRGRFAPAGAASEGTRAAEAAAFEVSSAVPALANAPADAALLATSTGATATATVSDQIADHVARLVASGTREMVMRLHPPELGEVMVRVAVNGRDVSAWFGSPQLQVQTAIADGIGQLQAGLGNAGYNLSGAWVGADASGERQQATSLPPLATMPVAATSLDVGMTAAARPSASGLNIYV
ncbi:MAG TPA: flagellar hook-length control protein FliK [Stellaceae bacterium]|nr:flagellar hook-length control protein FliK [Stellaceae bacterium]